MKPKPTKKTPEKTLDIANLSVADIQGIMNNEDPYYRCISAVYRGMMNDTSVTCAKYTIRLEDTTVGKEYEDLAHIYFRDDGSFWIRY